MKPFGIAMILTLFLASLGCGGLSSAPDNTLINGSWKAGLTNPDGSAAFGFTATLTQSGTTVGVSELDFVTSSSCFGAGTTATGLFTVTGTTHGVTSGTYQMTVTSGPDNQNGANTLQLHGTFVRNAISGGWALTGTGTQCSAPENAASGNFTMLQNPPPSS